MNGRLWATWRMEYITGGDAQGCFLCEYPRQERDTENLILARTEHCFVIMNRYPYTNGHLLVAPYRHEGDPGALSTEEYSELTETVRRSVAVIDKAMGPDGMNVGFNLGKVAGAGLEEHLHFHLVPRWNGDNNMMPVLGAVRVISEGLGATFGKLEPFFNEAFGSAS